MKIVGQRLPHESALGHVTGDALYTDDIAARHLRVLHAWPVIAPHAHALLLRLNVGAALEQDGVVTTLTRDDVPGEGDTGHRRRDEPLFPKEVMYHSQPIAWILGETQEAARLGAARVEADFIALPSILTIQEAIAAKSFHDGPLRIESGAPVQALAKCDHRLRGELYIGGQEHFYLETQAAFAQFDEGDGIVVETPTQHPSGTQEIVARVLGIPRNKVTITCSRIGGAFGGKETQANPWAAIAALGTWKTRRPVRVCLTRKLDMALTGKRHPFFARFAVGFERNGALRALRLSLYSDGGWSLDLSSLALWGALLNCDNAYRIPNIEVCGWVTKTHKTSQTAFRGFGAPQGILVIEEVLDRIARTLRIPTYQVRQRNIYRAGDATHYGQPVKDADRIHRIWDRLKTTSSFVKRRREIERLNAATQDTKRGIGIIPVKLGISFVAKFLNQGSALVLMYRDGSVQINHGGTEMGQGLHTKIQQIAAESLGLDFQLVRVMSTRTDKIPNSSPTAASVGTDLNGAAVVHACRKIVDRLLPIAAEMLDCSAEKVRFKHGFARGPKGRVSLKKIADLAYLRRVPLMAEGHYQTPGVSFDDRTGRGEPFHYYAYGAAVSEVEVDGVTGNHRILRADLLEDVGVSTSPQIDLGQIEGGFVQGIGWLTLEELLWDDEGRLITDSAASYKIPSWGDLPEVLNVSFLPRASQPHVVFGSKAVGEPPLMLAISVREAIRDAIAAFGADGAIPLDSPATPERIFWAVRRAIASNKTKQAASENEA